MLKRALLCLYFGCKYILPKETEIEIQIVDLILMRAQQDGEADQDRDVEVFT